MPLPDITDPEIIKFLIEVYRKEDSRRRNWNDKHKAIILQAATLARKPTNYFDIDVISHSMKEGMAAVSRDHIVAGYHKMKKQNFEGIYIPRIKDLRHEHSIVNMGLGDPKDDPRISRPDSDLTSDPIMRPVDPNITKILYKPYPEYGGQQYLKKRSKLAPENKYYFPECVNFDYGWRITDSHLQEKATHGRCWHLMKALKSRTGPKPDPPHYKSPNMIGRSSCADV